MKPTVSNFPLGACPLSHSVRFTPITFLLFSRLFTKNSCLMKPPLLQPEDEACNGSRADFSCRNCRKVCPSPSTTVVVVLYPFSLLLDSEAINSAGFEGASTACLLLGLFSPLPVPSQFPFNHDNRFPPNHTFNQCTDLRIFVTY